LVAIMMLHNVANYTILVVFVNNVLFFNP
jgi:hypothetical protein